MNRRERAAAVIRDHPGLLVCPLCGDRLQAASGAALSCPGRHSFDLSASGYANLLTRAVRAGYDAAQMASRRKVCEAGFFDGIVAAAAGLIRRHCAGPAVVLDAGCGEGSQLSRLLGKLGGGTVGVGADISKEGVRLAARDYPGVLWLVADLARLPIADGSVNIVLNVLSPSNYAEFDRVLRGEGLLVKAVPGTDYLKELRRALYGGGERERYSNEKVVDLFKSHYDTVEFINISSAFSVPEELWGHVVAMTPLTWGAGEERARVAAERPLESVTLDFVLMAGRKKTDNRSD